MRKFRHKSDSGDPAQEKQLRAACYVRVSTEEQAQHGYSIEAQKEKLAQACTLHNYKLAGTYVAATNGIAPKPREAIIQRLKKKIGP